jgi:hypothetical protein
MVLNVDPHTHRTNERLKDGKPVEPERVLEQMLVKNVQGIIFIEHAKVKNYLEALDDLKEEVKNYSNLVAGVELSIPVRICDYDFVYHITYLDEDFYFLNHATSTSGLFLSVKKAKLYKGGKREVARKVVDDEEFYNKYGSKIVESTKDLEDVLFLNRLGLTVLYGSDVHPDKNNEYNGGFGRKGIILKGEKFTKNLLIESISEDRISCFQIQNNRLFTTYYDEARNSWKKKKKVLDAESQQ